MSISGLLCLIDRSGYPCCRGIAPGWNHPSQPSPIGFVTDCLRKGREREGISPITARVDHYHWPGRRWNFIHSTWHDWWRGICYTTSPAWTWLITCWWKYFMFVHCTINMQISVLWVRTPHRVHSRNIIWAQILLFNVNMTWMNCFQELRNDLRWNSNQCFQIVLSTPTRFADVVDKLF